MDFDKEKQEIILKAAEAVKLEIKGIEDKIKAGVEADTSALKAKLEAWETTQKEAGAEFQKQLDHFQAEVKKLQQAGHSTPIKQALADIVVKAFEADEKAKAWLQSGGNEGSFNLSLKVPGTMTFATSTTGQVVDNVYGPMVGEVRRPQSERVRTLFSQGTMAGDKYPFPYQSNRDGTAGTTAEGSKKNQVQKMFALKEFAARKITALLVVSEEMLADLPMLGDYLATQGVQDLMDAEDTQLLYGDGLNANLKGLTTYIGVLTAANIDASFSIGDTQGWDCILAARAALASRFFVADTVVVNPFDFYAMLGAKGDNGQYVAPFVWNNGMPYIWGIPLRMSTAITVGNLLVGNFAVGAKIMQREGISVASSNSNNDDFEKNLISMRMEERLAFPVFHEDAFFWDSFADIKAKIAT